MRKKACTDELSKQIYQKRAISSNAFVPALPSREHLASAPPPALTTPDTESQERYQSAGSTSSDEPTAATRSEKDPPAKDPTK